MAKINEQSIIDQALGILEDRLRYRTQYVEGGLVDSPANVRTFLKLKLADKEHEVFCVMFLTTRGELISFDELFRGTIDGASVYPREVVKAALQYNAAAVIFSHNHPSGIAEPSRADEQLTGRLKSALELIDVRVLDHFIVGEGEPVSFAERGLL